MDLFLYLAKGHYRPTSLAYLLEHLHSLSLKKMHVLFSFQIIKAHDCRIANKKFQLPSHFITNALDILALQITNSRVFNPTCMITKQHYLPY